MTNTTLIQDRTTGHIFSSWLLSFVLLWARFYLALPLFDACWLRLKDMGKTIQAFEEYLMVHPFALLPSSLAELMTIDPIYISADLAAYVTIFGGLIIAVMVMIGLFGRFFSLAITIIVTLILFSAIEISQTLPQWMSYGFVITVNDYIIATIHSISSFLHGSIVLVMWTPELLEVLRSASQTVPYQEQVNLIIFKEQIAWIIMGLILIFTGPYRVSLDALRSRRYPPVVDDA